MGRARICGACGEGDTVGKDCRACRTVREKGNVKDKSVRNEASSTA